MGKDKFIGITLKAMPCDNALSARAKFFEYMGLIVSDALATVVESHTGN